MNIKHQLYLSIGLLSLTIGSITQATAAQAACQVIYSEDHCDDILHAIFSDCFFNDKDKTTFSQIIIDLIAILQSKKQFLDAELQQKYDELINLLDENKHKAEFGVWARILPAPELKAILPLKTQAFLDSIPDFKKIRTLIKRLAL